MNDYSSDKTKNYNRAFIIIYLVLLLITAIAIGMPLFQSRYIYPRFEKQLLGDKENEAVRTAKHMTRTIFTSYSGGKFVISDEIKKYFGNMRKDFNLWKIKIYSRSGETIYSTSDAEIGELNKNVYFHEIVSKGEPYTKVVEKNTKNLENQIVDTDVVETYVPIMNGGDFSGAFELYYDITMQKKSMDALISQVNYLLYISTAIIIMVVVLTSHVFRNSMQERLRFEKTLLKMANSDELTGLYNRRGFIELLEWELRKVERYQRRACILLFDLDHFKNVNDVFGHQAGDNALVAVARRCRRELRRSDIFARYGGEEFIVLLPDTDQESALKVAEKLRLAIESTPVSTDEGAINLTISVGVAAIEDKDKLSIDGIIKSADDSLYLAKRGGRNRICCAQ